MSFMHCQELMNVSFMHYQEVDDCLSCTDTKLMTVAYIFVKKMFYKWINVSFMRCQEVPECFSCIVKKFLNVSFMH